MLLDRRGVSGGGKFIQAFCSVRADTMTKHERPGEKRNEIYENLFRTEKVRRVFAENIE